MKRTAGSVFFAAIFLTTAIGVSAQSPRNTPKPLATPPPRVLTGAEIISRASDLIEPTVVLPAETNDPASESTISENAELKALTDRIKLLESGKKADPDAAQKRLLLNLDILTRAEQRSETLRKQLFDMIEKENSVRSRIEQISFDSRPEMIERQLQLAGSMRPEEIRENRRKSLLAEQANLEALLSEIQSTRSNVAANLQRSESLVEKLRAKLEKDIDDALLAPDKSDNDLDI